jgi:hypothetical protein
VTRSYTARIYMTRIYVTRNNVMHNYAVIIEHPVR